MTAHRSRSAPALLGLALAVGCGGSSGNGSDTGIFVDSPVAGLDYEGRRYASTTGDGGGYRYVPGAEVCFSLGFIPLGCGEGAAVFSPLDLYPDARSDDDRVLNVVRFLLSLDADGDPSNGIDVREVTTLVADGDIDFDQSLEAFESDPLVQAFVAAQGFDGELADAEAAAEHLAQSLDEHLYFEQALVGRWLYTAWSGDVPSDSSSVKIARDELPQTGADVSEDGDVLFAVEGDRRDEVCFHEGVFEQDDLVMGVVDCRVPDEVAAAALAFDAFRMDRLDPETVFDTSDLFGEWELASTFGEGPLSIDEGNADDFLASVSGSGKVHFETVEEIDAGPEDCVYDGQMNDAKDFASGGVRCSASGKGVWSLEPAGDAL